MHFPPARTNLSLSAACKSGPVGRSVERGVLLCQQESQLKGVLVSVHELCHRVTISVQKQDPTQDVSMPLPASITKKVEIVEQALCVKHGASCDFSCTGRCRPCCWAAYLSRRNCPLSIALQPRSSTQGGSRLKLVYACSLTLCNAIWANLWGTLPLTQLTGALLELQ